jgi:hypothetical protein
MTTDIFAATAEFNSTVLGMRRPLVPTPLHPDRKQWTRRALQEEVTEFDQANSLEAEVDALVDVIYFAAGRLYEMGVDGPAVFDEVHRANMEKRRGELSKRPGSRGHDAVKPVGWTPPNVAGVIAAQRRPKLIVVGHGRHGKDTVAEMLAAEYGLRFTSSSLFCSERVVMPLLDNPALRSQFLRTLADDPDPKLLMECQVALDRMMDACYASAQECFDDRHDFRQLWFQAIRWYCSPPERLAKEILAENDVYCGVRSSKELHGAVNADVADMVVWVDASKRVALEPPTSMELEPWMAHAVINNNGSLDDLRHNVRVFMEGFYG